MSALLLLLLVLMLGKASLIGKRLCCFVQSAGLQVFLPQR